MRCLICNTELTTLGCPKCANAITYTTNSSVPMTPQDEIFTKDDGYTESGSFNVDGSQCYVISIEDANAKASPILTALREENRRCREELMDCRRDMVRDQCSYAHQ